MTEVIELIDKVFGVSQLGCPLGSCTEEFLLNKAIETIERSSLDIGNKRNLMQVFRENMWHGQSKFSNGKHAGKWYIGIIQKYFN